MMTIWQPIKNYEGLYEVSNHGQVRSLYDWRKHSLRQEPKILKPFMTNVLCVDLYNRMRVKSTQSLARLVALSFLPNPNNYRFILHKDGNLYNNCVDNLIWSYISHRTIHHKPKPVKCVQNNTIYRSIYACEKELGLSHGSIYSYFKYSRPHIQGYSFEMVGDMTVCQKSGNQ